MPKKKERSETEFEKIAEVESKCIWELHDLIQKWMKKYYLTPSEISGILTALNVILVNTVVRAGLKLEAEKMSRKYIG